jgi:hypothetical protein
MGVWSTAIASVVCDHCGDESPEESHGNIDAAEGAAVRTAKAEGWKEVGGKWVCPECLMDQPE